MSPLEQHVDPVLLDRILAWVQGVGGIVEFDREQAVPSVFVAQHWRPESAPPDEDATFLIALTNTFWTWLDDRCDKHLQDEEAPIAWGRLIGIAEGDLAPDRPAGPEEAFLLRLSEAIREKSQTAEEYACWLRECTLGFRGTQLEEQAARTQVLPSFAERLEYGAWSIAASSVLYTAYLVYGLGRHRLRDNRVLAHLEHCFSAYQRIVNDIKSAEKERREGRQGCVANLVLLLERSLPPQLARDFVWQQAVGYRRLIQTNLEILGPANPFARLVRSLFELAERMYQLRPERYEVK
jgi:hypothetical protein